eukprot:6212378-Pleurochrysis_carterae.AAC.3
MSCWKQCKKKVSHAEKSDISVHLVDGGGRPRATSKSHGRSRAASTSSNGEVTPGDRRRAMSKSLREWQQSDHAADDRSSTSFKVSGASRISFDQHAAWPAGECIFVRIESMCIQLSEKQSKDCLPRRSLAVSLAEEKQRTTAP